MTGEPLLTFPPHTGYDDDDAAVLPAGVELVHGSLSLGTDITVDQALAAYPDTPTAELIEGNLYVNPAPHPRHAVAVHAIGRWIEGHIDPEAWNVHQNINVRLNDRTLLIPDLTVDRASVVGDAAWIDADAVAIAVEVLSPGEHAFAKADRYIAAGVGAVWSVDLDAHTIHTNGHHHLDTDRIADMLWPANPEPN